MHTASAGTSRKLLRHPSAFAGQFSGSYPVRVMKTTAQERLLAVHCQCDNRSGFPVQASQWPFGVMLSKDPWGHREVHRCHRTLLLQSPHNIDNGVQGLTAEPYM